MVLMKYVFPIMTSTLREGNPKVDLVTKSVGGQRKCRLGDGVPNTKKYNEARNPSTQNSCSVPPEVDLKR